MIAQDIALKEKWTVTSNTTNFMLQSVVDQITIGNKGEGGINLKPFYQRDYKFTRKDESLLMESLLGGIPIPVIYMASDTSKIPHVSNVIDGQHRLMAVFRFLTNKFKLTGLDKYKELNDSSFEELHPTIQNKFKHQISLSFQLIHIQNDPELEIEIFTRYNQGTNPLTKQEIRHVVYDSFYNNWLVKLVKELQENESSKSIFNINKKRFSDKAIHQELYVMLGIYSNLKLDNYSFESRQATAETNNRNAKKYLIEKGINQEFFSSPEYVNEIMGFARKLNEEESELLIKDSEKFIFSFIRFFKNVFLDNGVNFPLSKEIYGPVKKLNHKMQTSILMIMVVVFYNLQQREVDFYTLETQKLIKDGVVEGFQNSKFPDISTSTTEPTLLTSTITAIMISLEAKLSNT
jgi:hypothetical protein